MEGHRRNGGGSSKTAMTACACGDEPTVAVRHMCMNRSKVGKYFEALESLLITTGLVDRPKQVWNMDETGVQLEHKLRRVLAQKGSKFLHARTSGNRETLTVIACINGAGESIPLHIIAKGKTSKSLHGFDMQSAPERSNWSVSPSGWTKQGIAKLWFEKSFLPNIGKERPQVLIVDGHDSHNFVELISVATENEIQIIELPAHTSHWLQPCDRTVFKPLKDAYNGACQELMNAYPGTTVSHSNFCSLFTIAWKKAVTPENISVYKLQFFTFIPVSNHVPVIWLCMPLNLSFEQRSWINTSKRMTRRSSLLCSGATDILLINYSLFVKSLCAIKLECFHCLCDRMYLVVGIRVSSGNDIITDHIMAIQLPFSGRGQ